MKPICQINQEYPDELVVLGEVGSSKIGVKNMPRFNCLDEQKIVFKFLEHQDKSESYGSFPEPDHNHEIATVRNIENGSKIMYCSCGRVQYKYNDPCLLDFDKWVPPNRFALAALLKPYHCNDKNQII